MPRLKLQMIPAQRFAELEKLRKDFNQAHDQYLERKNQWLLLFQHNCDHLCQDLRCFFALWDQASHKNKASMLENGEFDRARENNSAFVRLVLLDPTHARLKKTDLASIMRRIKTEVPARVQNGYPIRVRQHGRPFGGKTAYLQEDAILECIHALVDNAVRHSFLKGSDVHPVEVKAGVWRRYKTYHFEVHVVDRGTGVSKQNMPKLFEKHFSTRFSSGDSTPGLGLSAIQELLEMHGGIAGVRSIEGQGSHFWFHFPLEKRQLAREKQENATKPMA